MTKEEKIETETHHNQSLTAGALSKRGSAPSKPPGRRVVAIQLDERQYAAYQRIGGSAGLKELLCPPGLCIECRREPSSVGTYLDSLCRACHRRDS